MSDRIAQSYPDCDGTTGKSMHSFQSVWMAHWAATSYNGTAGTQNHVHNLLGNKENDQDTKPHRSTVELESVTNLSKPVKRLRGSETPMFEVINETLRPSSRTISNESLGCQSLSLPSPCRNGASSSSTKIGLETHEMLTLRPQLDLNTDSPMVNFSMRQSCLPYPKARPVSERSGQCGTQPEATFQEPLNRMKPHSFFSSGSVAESRPLLDNPSHIASHIVPRRDTCQYVIEEGDNTRKAFISRSSLAAKDKMPILRMFGPEHYNYQTQSAFSGCENKLDSCPEPGRSITPYLRQNDTLLLNAPSTSSKHHPKVVGEKFQSTHSMLLTKYSGANLHEKNKVNGHSRIWSEFNGKTSLSYHDSPSTLFGHHKGGVKLQLLDNSTGSDGKENIKDSKTSEVLLKNESSAETVIMDMDVFQEKNHLSGIRSSRIKKVNEIEQSSSPRLALGCPRKEAKCEDLNLDINLELPAPTDNMEPTSSRTQSLDLEWIQAHTEKPSSSRTDLYPEGILGQEPSSRWVKRLKMSASDSFGFGTESSNFGESSHEKANKYLRKITEATITSSEPTAGKLCCKELVARDRTPGLSRNSGSSSMSIIKKDQESLTSHSWIRRLLNDRAASAPKRPQPVVVSEHQSPNVELDDLQKKQFPSIAAMALMGKAMNGFQPCEFQNRGSFVVWNAKSC